MRIALFILFFSISGCINVRMANMQTKPGNTIIFKGNLNIPKETTSYLHTFRLGTGEFTIHLGESLQNYIDQYINLDKEDYNNDLSIFVNSFSISSRTAYLEIRFIIKSNDNIVFDEIYVTKGGIYEPSGWGAVNPVLRKTTNDAVSLAFEEFSQEISDETDPKIRNIIFIDPDSNY
jgi:hypothetical protein